MLGLRRMPFSLSISSMLGLILPLLFTVPIAGRPNALGDLKVAQGPVPPTEEGPPLSTYPARDITLIWREIVAIVGAYCFLVTVFLGCLLTVGRRLRRSALQSNQTLEMEILKPLRPTLNTDTLQTPQTPQTAWPSPMTPMESQPWQSPPKGKNRSLSAPWPKGDTPLSRTGSVSTVDENVVRADRMRAQEEMERLYAAVMEHDEQMAEARSNGGLSPTRSPRPNLSPLDGPVELRNFRQRQLSYQSHSPVSPLSPLSQEIPSPTYTESQFQQFHLQHQQQHYEPQSQFASQQASYPQEASTSPRSEKPSRLSALSFLSSRSRAPKKLRRESVRNLPISPPILSPASGNGAGIASVPITPGYPDGQPLSPRIYHPGPPPLNPIQQQQQQLKAKSKAPHLQIPRHTSIDSNHSAPPPLHLRSAGSSTSTLPFRVAFNPPLSAPPTKTTIVERRESILGPLGPRTGIPQTPYSPYMPFTPITPLTPSHMVKRADRKQRKKQEGVRVQTEADLVMSDEEIWS